MKKITYPVLAFGLVLLVMLGLYTVFYGQEEKGRVLSEEAVRPEKPGKSRVVSPEKQNAQYEEVIVRSLAQVNLPEVFPGNSRDRESIAAQWELFHASLLELSVPPEYQSLHLKLAVLSSKMSQSLSENKADIFVQAVLELNKLPEEFSWLKF